MLAAVLSDGTAVNIVKRGDDIVRDGVRLPRLVDESGARYLLWADVPVNGSGDVEGRYISIADGLLSFASVVVPSALYDGIIILFDCDNYEENACPEALDWLCRNYGIAFSPAGLYLYESASVLATYAVTSSACIQHEGGNVFVLNSAQDDYSLTFPSGSATVLGCDGSAVPNSIDATVVPSGSLEDIRSETAAEYNAAYNTWLFYLASGLPKSVFEDI